MRMTVYTTMAVLLFFAASASARSASGGVCPLSTLANGQTVTIHGKVGQAPHDMALVVPDCSEAVVLVYAGDPESRESDEKLSRMKVLGGLRNIPVLPMGRLAGKAFASSAQSTRSRLH